MLLRTGKTPSGAEVANHVRRLVRRIRRHWPTTRITLRGDGHYGRPEPMAWCEANDVDYVFGLPGNRTLHADPVIAGEGDACATDRALRELVELRRYAETRYAAKSWGTTKRLNPVNWLCREILLKACASALTIATLRNLSAFAEEPTGGRRGTKPPISTSNCQRVTGPGFSPVCGQLLLGARCRSPSTDCHDRQHDERRRPSHYPS